MKVYVAEFHPADRLCWRVRCQTRLVAAFAFANEATGYIEQRSRERRQIEEDPVAGEAEQPVGQVVEKPVVRPAVVEEPPLSLLEAVKYAAGLGYDITYDTLWYRATRSSRGPKLNVDREGAVLYVKPKELTRFLAAYIPKPKSPTDKRRKKKS